MRVAWFSAGCSSFVAAYYGEPDRIVYIDVANQHPDSMRFLRDAERVLGREIETERTFRCESCGFEIDRDLNAAINILVAGSAPETLNGRGAVVRPAYTAADRDETPTWRERPARPGAARSDSRVRTRLN